MSAILILAILFFFTQKAKMVGTGPFPTLQRLSPSSSFEIDGKICQGILTRIDRTIQECCARRIDLLVSDDEAWVTTAVSAKPAQRAHFTISTQGIVTHSQAQSSEASAQPTFFMSARPKPAETPNLSLARFCAAQSCASAYKDALKEYKPQQVKDAE